MRHAIVTAVTVLTFACSAAQPAAVSSSPTPTIGAAVPTATFAPTAAVSPSALITPTPITDLSQVFTSSTGGWRPSGTTLVVDAASGSRTTLVAVPFGASGRTGTPIPLVTFPQGAWSLRPDGGAVAVGVATGDVSRIAIWDVRSGAARWLMPADPRRSDASPLWSRDGASIYYMSAGDDGKRGFFQVGADGAGVKQIALADDRTGPPQEVTPDGKGLIWSRGQAGGSVEILDIATGVSRHLENVARVVSWRAAQPRVLLSVGGCCAGRPGGSLVAWDDIALTSRVVAERSQFGDVAFGAGAWDQNGRRVAAVRYDNASPYEGSLVILDPETGATQPIAGTLGASVVRWLAEGIVFTVMHTRQPAAELLFLPNGGGSAVSLYKTDGIYGIEVVRP